MSVHVEVQRIDDGRRVSVALWFAGGVEPSVTRAGVGAASVYDVLTREEAAKLTAKLQEGKA